MEAERPARSLDLEAFRRAYSAFLKTDRILLTGHSHQAWPDVAREAMTRFFDASASFVDDKWSEEVFPLMDRVGRRVLARLGFDGRDAITFGKSTHELVFRLLSCLGRPARVVSTTGEFHSLDRQLLRLAEDGVEIAWVSAMPRESIADRLLAELDRNADLVAVSAVLFEDASIVQGLERVLARAEEMGIPALIDAYHAFNVVPLEMGSAWERAFVTAGGYKYAQFGEGVCFLRVPPNCDLRPVYTGWFSDFGSLDAARDRRSARLAPVAYGAGGARFAGATFDPVGLYRADAVLDHFDGFGLDVAQLRAISTRQTTRIVDALGEARVPIASALDEKKRGGFVSARVRGAGAIAARLRERGVFVDARGDLLRLGPAPYLTDDEIDAGCRAAIEEVRRAEA